MDFLQHVGRIRFSLPDEQTIFFVWETVEHPDGHGGWEEVRVIRNAWAWLWLEGAWERWCWSARTGNYRLDSTLESHRQRVLFFDGLRSWMHRVHLGQL